MVGCSCYTVDTLVLERVVCSYMGLFDILYGFWMTLVEVWNCLELPFLEILDVSWCLSLWKGCFCWMFDPVSCKTCLGLLSPTTNRLVKSTIWNLWGMLEAIVSINYWNLILFNTSNMSPAAMIIISMSIMACWHLIPFDIVQHTSRWIKLFFL